MALWMLALVVSAVLATESLEPIKMDPSVIQMQNFVKDNMKVANILMPLYASTAAYAILLVELKSAEIKIPPLAKTHRRTDIVENLQAEVNKVGDTVKCATAAMYLLLINRNKYSNYNCDRRNELVCVQRYHGQKENHGKNHTQATSYVDALGKSDFKATDSLAHTIFNSAHEDYEANICNDLSAFVLHADEETSNDVVDKIVDLLKHKFKATRTVSGGTGSIRHGNDDQYQHDWNEFNTMVKMIRENHPIDWDALKWSLKKAITAIKAADGTTMCELAMKPVKIYDELINNVQRDLMFYLPYELPDIEFKDVRLTVATLEQLQRCYEKAFSSQMKILGINDSHKKILKEMRVSHIIPQKEKKIEALKAYLKKLNELGETNIMPQRFPANKKYEPLHKIETDEEIMWRKMEPNVSFLPRLPWVLEMEKHSSSLIGNWRSRKELHEYMQYKIDSQISNFPLADPFYFSLKIRDEIKKHGKHIVYYDSWEGGSKFYQKVFEDAFADLKRKDQHTPLTIQLGSFYCQISADIWNYIEAYYDQECEKPISDIGMFRKLLMMIQYADAHTTHISAGLEDKNDEFVNHIYKHINHAVTKYKNVLSQQLNAATYLDVYEAASLTKVLADEKLVETEVKKKISSKVENWKKNDHKMNEKMCRNIFAEIVEDHQAKLSKLLSSMVYAPIVLNGNFYLSDIITIFYGVQNIDVDVADLVWKYLNNVVHTAVEKLDRLFIFNEKQIFVETARTAIVELKAKYDARQRQSGFECQLQLEALIRQFYVQFVDMLRSMETEEELEKRVHANIDMMAPWLDKLHEADRDRIIRDIERYLTPLDQRISNHVKDGNSITPKKINDDSKAGADTDNKHVEQAQEHRFEDKSGSFVESLKHHIDQRIATLNAQAVKVSLEHNRRISKIQHGHISRKEPRV